MIKRIKVSNFRGIEKLETDLDLITIFCGANRRGKTSAIRSLEWAISGNAVKKNIVRTGSEEARVIVSGDRSIIERSIVKGSTKGKLSAHKITPNGNELIPNAEKLLETNFPTPSFDPINFCFMDNKSRSLLIRNALENKGTMEPEEAREMGFDLDPSKSVKKQLEEWYEHYYEERRVIGAEIKGIKGKLDSATGLKAVTDAEIADKEAEIKNLETAKESTRALEAKANIAKQNAQTLSKLQADRDRLIEELSGLQEVDLGATEAELAILKNKFQVSETEEKDLFESIKVLQKTLEIIGSDRFPVCPISSKITCKTDMNSVVAELKRELNEKKQLVEESHKLNKGRKLLIEEKQVVVNSQSDIKLKKISLDRINSTIESLGSLEQIVITKSVASFDEDLKREREALTLMKVNKSFTDDGNLEGLEKKRELFDSYVKKIRNFLDNELPQRAKLDIPGIMINDEGIFFKGIPLEDESTSVQVRLALAVLKKLYPAIGLITVDRLEVMDEKTLEGFIKTCKDQGIQVVASYVGEVPDKIKDILNVKTITM